jgi:rhamnulokinase
MNTAYIAFDLGAESGRCVTGTLADGRLDVKEVYRFSNGMSMIGKHLYWDMPYLYKQVLQGLQTCHAMTKKKSTSIGFDTWGVDFGLLDAGGNLLGMPHAYRDIRTDGMMELFFRNIEKREIYERTGIQFLPFNTLYQLFAMKQQNDPFLDAMHEVLFIPDLFIYLLTGKKATEFTYATTSQLYNSTTGRWDEKIFEALAIPVEVMQDVVPAGTVIGNACDPCLTNTGLFGTPVIAVATHDTGSAIAAVPCQNAPCLYISCGTWSLMGFEAASPMITDETYRHNFTNEGGVAGKFRVLKNITGLWLLQECRKVWSRERSWTYDDLLVQARSAEPFRTIVDVDHESFLHPDNMVSQIATYAQVSAQPGPETIGQFTRSILEGLAMCYRHTLDEIRKLEPRSIDAINMVGGGSKNPLLCQMTANATGIPVLAGPSEAAAIGNILVQAMALKHLGSLDELRAVVRRSFEIKEYLPEDTKLWEEQFQHFKEFIVLREQ